MTNERIKSAVIAAGLPNESRVKMAARLGIPYTTLRRLEQGLIHKNRILADYYFKLLVPVKAKRKAARS